MPTRGGAGAGGAEVLTQAVFRVRPAAGVQGGWAMPAHAEVHDPSSIPHAHLRSQPCCRQVPVLVLRFSAEEDEEVFWRDRVLRPGAVFKTQKSGRYVKNCSWYMWNLYKVLLLGVRLKLTYPSVAVKLSDKLVFSK